MHRTIYRTTALPITGSLKHLSCAPHRVTHYQVLGVPSKHLSCAPHRVTHYQVLGVPSNADKKQIKAAYFKKAKQCHPDLHPNNAAKSAEYLELQNSYNTLLATTHSPRNARADPPPPHSNPAQQVDWEFLKSVERAPVSSSMSDHVSEELTTPGQEHRARAERAVTMVFVVSAVAGLACLVLYLLLRATTFLRSETEEEREFRLKHEYYKTLNRAKKESD